MSAATVRPTNSFNLIYQHISSTLPLVDKELGKWRELAQLIPDISLREQALASIRCKAFHCQGGSIFASYPGVERKRAVEFIVAYQTISDYLDNLVDSMQLHDERAFAQLHLAMEEAIVADGNLSDYYAYYPCKDDGGYLLALVRSCRDSSQVLSHHLVRDTMGQLAKLYSSLQTYKHLHMKEREGKLRDWIDKHLHGYPQLGPWEFAAATGSTLGEFCLYAAAFDPELAQAEVNEIKTTYFPWICGLHILLDYLVDQCIDRETAELNFVSYYSTQSEAAQRLQSFVDTARSKATSLRHSEFHQLVVDGLLALYLSDPKAAHSEVQPVARQLLRQGGRRVRLLYGLCRLLRTRQSVR